MASLIALSGVAGLGYLHIEDLRQRDRAVPTSAGSSPAFKIIIVGGQANAVGRARVSPNWQVVTEGIYQLGRFGDTNWTIMPATEPLAYWDPSGAGFVLTAVSMLRTAEPGDYLIIPAAMGGSGFVDHMWTASIGPLYRDLLVRARYVLDRFPRSSVRAVFWHGGESEWVEADGGYNEAYPKHMLEMVTSLRADLGLYGVPFLMGGLVPAFAAKQTPNPDEVLPAVAAAVGACFVPATGLLPEKDGIHFELGSQVELGRRYFLALHDC